MSRDTTEPRKVYLFIVAVWALAAGLFLYGLSLPRDFTWVDLVLFAALAAMAESWYVAMSQSSGMSLSFTVHFAAAILFGPVFAGAVTAFGILVGDGLVNRRPASRVAFNIAQMSVAAMVCALLYRWLAAAGPVDLVTDAPAIALSGLAYLVINDTLVSGIISINGRSFLSEWVGIFRDIMLPYASMAPLGALVAFTYQTTPWAVLYFIPLTLVIHHGFKLFVTLQHETDHALVALADSIDKRDQYTYQHSQRVAVLATEIAERLGLPAREVDLIAAAARVHDLGKIATDNRVLFKQSSLTADERRLIEAHPAEGGELAGRFSMFRQGRRFIRHHHERWDGKGYPDGLAGEDIPVGARIIAVADSYDAMTSDRPYRKALPHEVAVIELRRSAGQQFDPTVVEAFVSGVKEQSGLRAAVARTQEQCSY